MAKKEYVTIPELAKIMGISRIAAYRKVKKGQVPAVRIGRNYAVPKDRLVFSLSHKPGEKEKRAIRTAVRKTVADYGETLKLLGRE